jgi:hypothetical protein
MDYRVTIKDGENARNLLNSGVGDFIPKAKLNDELVKWTKNHNRYDKKSYGYVSRVQYHYICLDWRTKTWK